MYAIDNNLPLPIGNQDVSTSEVFFNEKDFEFEFLADFDNDETIDNNELNSFGLHDYSQAWYVEKSKEIYNLFSKKYTSRFDWIDPNLFQPTLKQFLLDDSNLLINILSKHGPWDPSKDRNYVNFIN